ncbi:MAG: hypothetical protein V1809_11455 [Planctomycetota bacterium]
MNTIKAVSMTSLLLVLSGCQSRPVPSAVYPRAVYPHGRYAVRAEADGVRAAAVMFAPGRDVWGDPAKNAPLKTSMPFGPADAGVLAVRIILWNESGHTLRLETDQISGMAGEAEVHPYPADEAADVVIASKAFQEAVRGSEVEPFLRYVLGGEMIVDAARGGISGAAATGGVPGGAAGAAKGAGKGLEKTREYPKNLAGVIRREYQTRAMIAQTLRPRYVADGLVFFPGEAGVVSVVVRVYDEQDGKTGELTLTLPGFPQ